MKLITFLSLLFVYQLNRSECGKHFSSNVNDSSIWGYKSGQEFKSPEHWKEIPDTSCSGSRQSPIDIKTDKVVYRSGLHPIVVKKIVHLNQSVSLEKHTYTIYLKFNENFQISFGGEKCLTPVGLHWHWGSNDTQGSEHKINGNQFPIEAHLVSYNCEDYTSFENASVSENGLFVIGFFYQIGRNNTGLSRIIDALQPLINNENDSVSLDEIHPRDILPHNIDHYYRYEGSLTTPPCTENVIWTILKDVQHISIEQLSFIRRLQFASPEYGNMVDNFRPVYQISGPSQLFTRIVYASFKQSCKTVANLTLVSISFIILSII